jgi:tRNA A58 N-methylase Trm61
MEGHIVSEDQYVLSAEKHKEAELLRFYRLQERIINPVAIRHLETIGVSKGWTCLEVGAGTGSIALWLSSCVESKGQVVATDIDTRFLQLIDAPSIEVRQLDILKDDLETSHYARAS